MRAVVLVLTIAVALTACKPGPAGMTALLFAAVKGHVEIARFLLARGASPLTVNRAGWTPAFAARWNRQGEIVTLFERAGVTDWDMKSPPRDPPSGSDHLFIR